MSQIMVPNKKCPKCGGELEWGYGLAGGGMGPYALCASDECDWFQKWQDPPESADVEVASK
jgi:hypothetical protein